MKRIKVSDPIPGYLGPEERWKALGVGVVKQAVLDWHFAVDKQKHQKTDTFEMKELRKDAENFLRSNLCELYSGLDGRTLLIKLNTGVL